MSTLRIIEGERIGRMGKIRLGCSAAIFDATGTRILLVRRADNGEWCLPGGLVEPGESVEETCIREVWEETGLHITITQLVGVYSSPHVLVEYSEEHRYQQVSLCFAGQVIDQDVAQNVIDAVVIDAESTAFGFFTLAETRTMPIIANSRTRIPDAFAHRPQAFIR